jgi:hypothetical protein
MSCSESIINASTPAMTTALTSLLSIPSTSFPGSGRLCLRYSATVPARISSTVRTACGTA